MQSFVTKKDILSGSVYVPREGYTYNKSGDEVRSGNAMSKRITSIRQPKKLAQSRGAKVAGSLDKLFSDSRAAQSALNTKEWEKTNVERKANGLDPWTWEKYINKQNTRNSRRRK